MEEGGEDRVEREEQIRNHVKNDRSWLREMARISWEKRLERKVEIRNHVKEVDCVKENEDAGNGFGSLIFISIPSFSFTQMGCVKGKENGEKTGLRKPRRDDKSSENWKKWITWYVKKMESRQIGKEHRNKKSSEKWKKWIA